MMYFLPGEFDSKIFVKLVYIIADCKYYFLRIIRVETYSPAAFEL